MSDDVLENTGKKLKVVKNERGLKLLPNGRWQVSFMSPGRRYHRFILGTSKTEAKAYLEQKRTEIREGRYQVSKKRVVTSFLEAVNKYLDWSKTNNSKSTYGIDVTASKSWLECSFFKNKTLDEITIDDAEKYKKHLINQIVKNGSCRDGKPLAPRTVDIRLGRLKRLFSLCLDWNLCEKNPLLKVKLLKRDNKIVRYLSPEEEDRLMKVSSPELVRVIQLALHTGMRRGEILSLTWSDVDFKAGIITIPATKSKGRRERYIPLTATALKVLQSIPRPINRTALVFSNKEGNKWDRLRVLWDIARKEAGLEDFRFHDLRHSFASRLVMSGVDLAIIKELLGHKDYETTLRYAHLAPERLKRAVSVLDSLGTILHESCTPEENK